MKIVRLLILCAACLSLTAANPSAKEGANDPKKHWAFKAPIRPAHSETKNKKWAQNPIDAFILAKLEKENLSPAPEADRVTLFRRLCLDLTGLPPTPEETDAFLADQT